MSRKMTALLSVFPLLLVIFTLYAGAGRGVFSIMLKWGEIVIVFSLLAGMFKLLQLEFSKLYRSNGRSIHPIVIILSFTVTFAAGLLNFESNRAVLNNSIKEYPEYLTEIVRTLINEDNYLKKYPARNKLVLYVAGKASSLFTPAEEMLKNADISRDEFNNLRSGRTKLLLNEDDVFNVQLIIEKTKKISLETVKIILPAAREMRIWFDHSVGSLPDAVLTAEEIRKSTINDLVLDDSKIEGSGVMLKSAIAGYLEKNNLPEIEKGDILVNYRDFVIFSGIGQMVISQYCATLDENISRDVSSRVFFAFLKTETISSPKIKGVLQWIYRRVYDPLFSAFMSLLFVSMIAVAYRRFSFKSYSLGVITVSAFIVICGFLPLPEGLQGPFSQGYMMNVFSMPVFIAMMIGTGAGIMFHYLNGFLKMFSSDGDKK
ncbi:MAG TPA: hypothetical protein PKG52_03505 [bacterium]|mgnify:CR=1 FL=1|nr:hypothetical protein [bacterium]HPS28913.1 hypothetical protein [bacterium]